MAAGVADFGSHAWAATIVGLQAPPAGYYIALLTSPAGPGMDGDILAELEPDPGAGYARQYIGAGAGNWLQNGPLVTSGVGLDYGVPTADWGNISHWAMLTAATSGDLYAWGEFLAPVLADASQQILIPIGGITLAVLPLEDSIAV